MNKVFNTKQVAEILEVHLNTVWQFLASGKLKGHKLGGNDKSKRHWRVWEQDLQAFINGQTPRNTLGAEPEHGDTVEYNSKPELVAGSAPTSK